jgi:hypothetical protein
VIRLTLGRRWALRDFVRIARAKRGKRRRRLERNAGVIASAFRAYGLASPDIESLVPCAVSKALREDLIHAYVVSTKPLKAIVGHLKLVGDAQRCQYCGINPEVDTLDHYLEKEIYPEFSVLHRNLIPSCGVCNRDRKPTVQAGVRSVLNLRDDPISLIPELLSVTVVRAGKGFRGLFSLKPTPPGAHPVAGVYARHFVSLDLARRFSRESAKELVEVLRIVVDTQLPAKGLSFSRRKAKAQLLSDASSRRAMNGPNDWRVAVRVAAAASEDFLDACDALWRQDATAT